MEASRRDFIRTMGAGLASAGTAAGGLACAADGGIGYFASSGCPQLIPNSFNLC